MLNAITEWTLLSQTEQEEGGKDFALPYEWQK